MARTADGLGFHLQVHDNYRMNYPIAPDWNPDHVIQDVYGQPLVDTRPRVRLQQLAALLNFLSQVASLGPAQHSRF